MAISIDWGGTNIITVPQSDLTLVSGVLYDLDTDWFRLQLKSLEDSEAGMPFPKTHNHNTTVSISGTTYARTIEILAPYSVKFEDTGTQYSVRTVGSNSNILDYTNGILVPTPLVSYISTNAAGLVETDTSGLTAQESSDLSRMRKWVTNAQRLTEGTSGNFKVWDDSADPDTDTPLETQDVTDKDGNAITLPAGAPARRSEAS